MFFGWVKNIIPILGESGDCEFLHFLMWNVYIKLCLKCFISP